MTLVSETLTGSDWQRFMIAASVAVHENIDVLSRLDAAAGDGDHGVNVTTALQHAADEIGKLEDPTPQAVLSATALSFFEEMGGAAGVLFGSFFTAAAQSFNQEETVDVQGLADGLGAGTDLVRKRGKADVGDKTMVDALVPAAEAGKNAAAAGVGICVALDNVAVAAREGVLSTATMTASLGRARYAQESSIGVEDPGATTVALIFEAWAAECWPGQEYPE